MTDLLTPYEMMKLFRITRQGLNAMVRRGELSPIRINERGDRRFWRHEVESILNKRDGEEVMT